VGLCEAGPAKALECEKAVWAFGDVSKDQMLSLAELSRMARFFGEHFDKQVGKAAAPGQPLPPTLPAALILGPVAAQLVMANFDYDGDGKISRSELYADLPEGKFSTFVAGLTQTSRQAIGQAAGPLFGMLAQKAITGSGSVGGGLKTAKPAMTPQAETTMQAKAAQGQAMTKPAPAVTPQADPHMSSKGPPFDLIHWDSNYALQGKRKLYEIKYTLQSNIAADVKRIDGTLRFKDKAGTPFMAIQLDQTRGVKARATATLGGRYPVNALNPEQLKLRDLPQSEVDVELTVKKVVLADGTVMEF